MKRFSAKIVRQRSNQSQLIRRDLGCVSSCVEALSAIHDTVGLPWWATIISGTVTVRTMLVPATLVAREANARLGQAAPQIRNLNILLRDALKRHAHDVAGRKRSAMLYARAVHGTLKIYGANPITAFFLMPAVHIPTFITFVLAIRQLPNEAIDYHTGGTFWFLDLASADPYCILPVLAVSTAYLNLRAPDAATESNRTLGAVLRNTAQISLFVALPITFQLPAGFHIYWISSSVFTAVSSRVMRFGGRGYPTLSSS